MKKVIKIALAGEGGQGVQSVAGIIAEAANVEGREALYIPNFGVEQRGGVSIAFLQIGSGEICSPKFQKADIVVALSERAVKRSRQYVDDKTTFVYDSSIEGVEAELPKEAGRILAIPAIEVSKRELHPRVFNIIIMGAVIKATGLVPEDEARAALEKNLGYKFKQEPGLRELNFKAITRGMELVEKARG